MQKPKLDVVQTQGGQYIIQRKYGQFFQHDGTFGAESTARAFSDVRHAIDTADELCGDTIRPRIRALLAADTDAGEREQNPAVDELTSRGQRLTAFRTGLQAILVDPGEAEMRGSCVPPPPAALEWWVVVNVSEHSGRVVEVDPAELWSGENEGGLTEQEICGAHGSVLSRHDWRTGAEMALARWEKCDNQAQTVIALGH